MNSFISPASTTCASLVVLYSSRVQVEKDKSKPVSTHTSVPSLIHQRVANDVQCFQWFQGDWCTATTCRPATGLAMSPVSRSSSQCRWWWCWSWSWWPWQWWWSWWWFWTSISDFPNKLLAKSWMSEHFTKFWRYIWTAPLQKHLVWGSLKLQNLVFIACWCHRCLQSESKSLQTQLALVTLRLSTAAFPFWGPYNPSSPSEAYNITLHQLGLYNPGSTIWAHSAALNPDVVTQEPQSCTYSKALNRLEYKRLENSLIIV